MVDLAAEKGIKAWTRVRPMEEANGAVFRFVLGY